ncbi:sigma factor-like helix-turn-helix DNA-binding protein [Streptomyces sp. NPDC006134]|uniref:transcriptional regulator n=1 Tax=Streptomyces sp. NPDC006134 TaxID=3154467 RepID=UPI00340DC052
MTQSPATPLPPPRTRRRLREAASLTRAQVAERLGVTRDTVRAWEKGRTPPHGREGEAYAKLLGDLAAGQVAEVTGVRDDGRASAGAAGRKDAAPTAGDVPVAVGAPAASAAGTGEAGAALSAGGGSASAGDRAAGAGSGSVPPAPPPSPTPAPTPAHAFDALYAFCAPGLVRQTYVLTGRRELARESVERAFQRAWEHWPEVARDRDPAGWVRAVAHEYALSPWHRFRPRYRFPEPPPADPGDRALMNVLLRLPPRRRRALLLYDGIGLGLPETAAETEASTPATANRLLRAREAVAARLPGLADPGELRRRLAGLAAAERLRAAEPPAVRRGSERRARFRTRAAFAFTAVLVGTTALTLRTAPTQYEPPVPPGAAVRGVPPRVAPGPLSDEELLLRARLREQLQSGPQRLGPEAR